MGCLREGEGGQVGGLREEGEWSGGRSGGSWGYNVLLGYGSRRG